MATSQFSLCFLLVVCGAAVQLVRDSNNQETEETLPMHMYRRDCWKHIVVPGVNVKSSLLSLGWNASNLTGKPRAFKGPMGIKGNWSAFETVLKDGFYQVSCVKDAMFQFGDKYGDNKHEYAIGDATGVSIVHYEAHVDKLEREEMTHEVCFNFCRTVPDMLYFGITNGRGCYCAPYFQPSASDSSNCDAVCVGNPSTMCGGKTKSSIFQMHMCSNTGADLVESADKTTGVLNDLTSMHVRVKNASVDMQSWGASFQANFSKVGDPEAAALMQKAKEYAGVLEHAAEDGNDALTSMNASVSAATGLNGSDFSKPAKITEAEDVVKDLEEGTTAGEVQLEKLSDLAGIAAPVGGSADALKSYYNMMYFVDMSFQDDSTTCSGDLVNKPIVGSNTTCAAACDAAIHDCVGFAHFPNGASGLCFLFSNFKTAVYYTGCAADKPKMKCMAKLSSFQGLSLKPKPGGTCKHCLLKAIKANRCH